MIDVLFENINIWMLYGLVIVFFIISLVMLIKLKVRGLFFVIPVVVFFVTSGVYTYQSILGQPTTRVLPEEFNVISYIADEGNKKIYLWIRENDKPFPMNYVIPYERPLHKKLHKKSEEVGKSKGAKGLKGKRKIMPDNKFGIDIQVYKFVDQKRITKEGNTLEPNSGGEINESKKADPPTTYK